MEILPGWLTFGAKRRGGNHEDGWQLCELIHRSSFIILYFVYIRFYIYIWGITVCIYTYIYTYYINIYICMYLCSSKNYPSRPKPLSSCPGEPPGVDSFPTQLCEAEEPLKMQWIPGWPWCKKFFDRSWKPSIKSSGSSFSHMFPLQNAIFSGDEKKNWGIFQGQWGWLSDLVRSPVIFLWKSSGWLQKKDIPYPLHACCVFIGPYL